MIFRRDFLKRLLGLIAVPFVGVLPKAKADRLEFSDLFPIGSIISERRQIVTTLNFNGTCIISINFQIHLKKGVDYDRIRIDLGKVLKVTSGFRRVESSYAVNLTDEQIYGTVIDEEIKKI